MEDKKRNNTGTFVLKVFNRCNGTWQGSIIWAEKKKERYFRSTLELLKMIESALDGEGGPGGKNEAGEGEHYETL